MAVTKPYVSTRKLVKEPAVVKPAPKKVGRPLGSKNKPKDDKPVDWESFAKKLQKALMKEMKKNDELEWAVEIYRKQLDEQAAVIEQLENRSWPSRTFNLKG